MYNYNNYFDFKENELLLKSYDDVSFFFIKKLKQDLPFAKIDYYINSRNLRTVTITSKDIIISLDLELGYVEFCGIEYDFNLYDLIKLIKAIQHYLLKYDSNSEDYITKILNPWGW